LAKQTLVEPNKDEITNNRISPGTDMPPLIPGIMPQGLFRLDMKRIGHIIASHYEAIEGGK